VLFLPLSSKDVRVGHRMTAKVRTFPFRGERGMVRNRRDPVTRPLLRYGSGSLRLLWRIVLRLDGPKTQANQGCCGFAVREGKGKKFPAPSYSGTTVLDRARGSGSEGIRARFRPLAT
jgi:hypothetical protein